MSTSFRCSACNGVFEGDPLKLHFVWPSSCERGNGIYDVCPACAKVFGGKGKKPVTSQLFDTETIPVGVPVGTSFFFTGLGALAKSMKTIKGQIYDPSYSLPPIPEAKKPPFITNTPERPSVDASTRRNHDHQSDHRQLSQPRLLRRSLSRSLQAP
jgi:hypothetical protein